MFEVAGVLIEAHQSALLQIFADGPDAAIGIDDQVACHLSSLGKGEPRKLTAVGIIAEDALPHGRNPKIGMVVARYADHLRCDASSICLSRRGRHQAVSVAVVAKKTIVHTHPNRAFGLVEGMDAGGGE